jgi:hypothetical protein
MDVIVLINVLEHIRDHVAAVAQLFRIARPGAAVIIEVPAGASLYDVYDRVLMHERRYEMRNLVALLENAGFVVERRSHLGFFLFPLFWLTKRVNQRRYPAGTRVDEQALIARMIAATRKASGLMTTVMKIEQWLRSWLRYPVGIRCLVTCRKPARAMGPRP